LIPYELVADILLKRSSILSKEKKELYEGEALKLIQKMTDLED